MKANKTLKILVGLGTAWIIFMPILGGLVYFFSIFSMFVSSWGNDGEPSPVFFLLGMMVFMLVMLIQIPVYYLTTGFYIVHAVRNRAGSEKARSLMALGIVFIPFLGMPIYYFTYIWPEMPPEWALEKSPAPRGGLIETRDN